MRPRVALVAAAAAPTRVYRILSRWQYAGAAILSSKVHAVQGATAAALRESTARWR